MSLASATDPAGAVAAGPARSFPRKGKWEIQPFHLLVPAAAIASLALSLKPFRDPDLYWHVLLGGQILHRHSVEGAGAGWSLVAPAHPWKTPEWLSEVVLHGFVSSAGWRGALVFQVLSSLAFLVALALVLLPRRDARAAAPVYLVVAYALAPYLQPRPQALSMVFLAWLAHCTTVQLRCGRAPRIWVFLPAVWLWAQLHGLWLLAPLALGVASVLPLLDRRDRRSAHSAARGLAVAVAAVAVGCVNPLGVSSLTLPLRLRSATHSINEWLPTRFDSFMTWGLLVLVAVLVVTWVRATDHVSRAEMVWVAGVFAFALMAYRNVAPATLLLAPLAADRLSALLRPRTAVTGGRERRLLLGAAAAGTVAVVAVGAVGAATVRPIPRSVPVGLVRALDDGAPHRVLDDYNLGGVILAMGGPKVRVAVDGRADYYGGAYLARYNQMMQMDQGWQTMFQRLQPDVAIIQTGFPLRDWLVGHGWTERARADGFSLLWRTR